MEVSNSKNIKRILKLFEQVFLPYYISHNVPQIYVAPSSPKYILTY